jgi:hypothetical protein
MKDPKTRMVQAWEIIRMSDLNLCLTTLSGKNLSIAGRYCTTYNE